MTDEGDGGNSVAVIDVQAMKLVGRIVVSRFRRPHGIALDERSGRLLVTTEKPHRLLAMDVVSRLMLRDYDVQGKSPHMVTLGPGSEWAFVSNTDTDAVAAVHLATGRVRVIPVGKRPQGSVLAPGGERLYVVNSESMSITIIDTRNHTVVGTIPTGGGAGRIAITPDGRTLVYNLQADLGVGFADVTSAKQVAFVSLGGRPLSLTMSRDGQKAYSSVQDQDTAFVISVAGRKIIRKFQLPKGAGPDPVIPLPAR
jgi:YVTN family beta-propeller protein